MRMIILVTIMTLTCLNVEPAEEKDDCLMLARMAGDCDGSPVAHRAGRWHGMEAR